MRKCPNQFQDCVPPQGFAETLARSGHIKELRVMSLSETARIINDMKKYDTQLSASDVLRIERRALWKLRMVLVEN